MSEGIIPEDKKWLPVMLYAIRDDDTGEIIWNARGYAYKSRDKALRKLYDLRMKNPEKKYSLVGWIHIPEISIDWSKVEFVSRKVK